MSLVDQIVKSAPKGSNPYAFTAEYVATIVPPKPSWYFPCIIAVGIVACILILTIASFIVMWKRSRTGAGVGLWFFKTQYGHSRSGLPYIVPNALTMFLLWNLIFMLLMQPYIWLNYFAYRSPNLSILSGMYFWYGFVFIWDSVGMWTSAFGTLYATLLPKLYTVAPSTQNPLKNFLLHPVTLNTLCFLPPLGLAITQIVTSAYSSTAWSNLVHTQYKLVDDLKTLGVQWASGGSASLEAPVYDEALKLGELLFEQKDISQTAFQRNAGTCAGWYILCIVLFTPTAAWLLCILHHAMKMQHRRVVPQPHRVPSTANSSFIQPVPTTGGTFSPPSHGRKSFRSGMIQYPMTATGSTDSGTGSAQKSVSTNELRRAFYTVGLQSVATLICMIATAGNWLWVCIDATRVVVTPNLHSFAILFNMWIVVIVGCLVNLFILMRSYRTADKNTRYGLGRIIPMSPMSPMRPTHTSPANSAVSSDQTSIFVHASTSTHIPVDLPGPCSVRAASKDDLKLTLPKDTDLRLGSAHSLSTVDYADQAKDKKEGSVEGWSSEERV